jgi:hypothetical protein
MKPSDQPTPVVDEVIAEVRRHKRAIMAEHGDDVDALLRDLRKRQKNNPRLVANVPPSALVREEPQ